MKELSKTFILGANLPRMTSSSSLLSELRLCDFREQEYVWFDVKFIIKKLEVTLPVFIFGRESS